VLALALVSGAGGELILLDAPPSLARAARILRTGRYASLETANADASREDVVARVVLVAQPARGGGCPVYTVEAVAGAVVLERHVWASDCSIGARVSLAAAAGAVGWLHERLYPAGALRAPGSQAYALERGDAAILARAPPAVDIAQSSAGLDWLCAAAEAGESPRVALRLRAPDEWARLRQSGWVRLYQAVVGLASLSVVELALSHLHALTLSSRHVNARASTAQRASYASAQSADAEGAHRPWHIGPMILVLSMLCALARCVYTVVDPLRLFGTFARVDSQLFVFVPTVVSAGAQALQLVYLHESVVYAGGIDSLMLVGAGHKAAVIGCQLAMAIAAVLLYALRPSARGALLLLLVCAYAALACACVALLLRARCTRTRARDAEHKLRQLCAGSCAVTLGGLAVYFTDATPEGAVASMVVAFFGLDYLAYTQCEHMMPIGVPPIRGPLRRAVELAREARHRLLHAACARRSRRVAPEPAPLRAAKSDWLKPPTLGRPTAVGGASWSDASCTAASSRVELPPSVRPAAATTSAALAEPAARASEQPPSPLPAVAALADSHLALGVSLACLRDFARSADELTATSTTAEMVLRVRQLTQASRRSFAELHVAAVASDGHPAVGRATVFVSHAQARGFVKLIDALDAFVCVHKLAREDAYFWCAPRVLLARRACPCRSTPRARGVARVPSRSRLAQRAGCAPRCHRVRFLTAPRAPVRAPSALHRTARACIRAGSTSCASGSTRWRPTCCGSAT
jgi:hypothetical protein